MKGSLLRIDPTLNFKFTNSIVTSDIFERICTSCPCLGFDERDFRGACTLYDKCAYTTMAVPTLTYQNVNLRKKGESRMKGEPIRKPFLPGNHQCRPAALQLIIWAKQKAMCNARGTHDWGFLRPPRSDMDVWLQWHCRRIKTDGSLTCSVTIRNYSGSFFL